MVVLGWWGAGAGNGGCGGGGGGVVVVCRILQVAGPNVKALQCIGTQEQT